MEPLPTMRRRSFELGVAHAQQPVVSLFAEVTNVLITYSNLTNMTGIPAACGAMNCEVAAMIGSLAIVYASGTAHLDGIPAVKAPVDPSLYDMTVGADGGG